MPDPARLSTGPAKPKEHLRVKEKFCFIFPRIFRSRHHARPWRNCSEQRGQLSRRLHFSESGRT